MPCFFLVLTKIGRLGPRAKHQRQWAKLLNLCSDSCSPGFNPLHPHPVPSALPAPALRHGARDTDGRGVYVSFPRGVRGLKGRGGPCSVPHRSLLKEGWVAQLLGPSAHGLQLSLLQGSPQLLRVASLHVCHSRGTTLPVTDTRRAIKVWPPPPLADSNGPF